MASPSTRNPGGVRSNRSTWRRRLVGIRWLRTGVRASARARTSAITGDGRERAKSSYSAGSVGGTSPWSEPTVTIHRPPSTGTIMPMR
ncbi:hypothetical protein O1Q96_17695 [Streptomyces sp. Qhu-G9]|uniref:hypothetical protein n=1 Tax=Streptomyces sp. Qhu-G9 TaxID=3452799 RepID=UPI0022AC225F|nr:hypothetical protein [Streptomyces aurantiacus]WAU81457.1 hypothetical protein O1Q96_17695 [Streptomyces aurantiacus]